METAKPQPRIIRAEFALSVYSPDQLPKDGAAEVALIGRSNVGKSSLLNALCGQKALSRVSKTPGRTQALNFFRVTLREDLESGAKDTEFWLVDVPGFGYAKAPAKEQERWEAQLSDYLATREELSGVLLLVDSRRELGDIEQFILEQMREQPFGLVLTKSDKLSRNEIHSQRAKLSKETLLPKEQILQVSTFAKGQPGLSDVAQFLASFVL